MKATRLRAELVLLAATVIGCVSLEADVRLPALFSDNMVLQRGVRVPVWGHADPAEPVTVTLGRYRATTMADENGRWLVRLSPLAAGGPYELAISGTNTIVLRNVLVGEVWVCSGQSNMAWPVSRATNAEQEIAQAGYARIRLFQVARAVAETPQDDLTGAWSECSPETVPGFSAVAYYFGREVHNALGVPVGLVHTSWGGTPAEAWTSLPALEAEPALAPLLEHWETVVAGYDDEAAMRRYEAQMARWREADEQARASGEPRPAQPRRPAHPGNSPNRPASLYNAMIAPLVPYAMRGAIWYQGESNAGRAYQYRRLFPTMIRDWRRAWGQGEFPFLFVQLANFQSRGQDPRAWAELREAQLMTLSLPNTGMAVTADVGEPLDIHPRYKQEVGRRLALAARAIAYGDELAHSGPIYTSHAVEGDAVRLRFRHTGGGLLAASEPLRGFTVAGNDRRFVWADAGIDGDTVVVRSDAVPRPVAVRYAWADDPGPCDLYNGEGLPASPFRTDDWPGVTSGVRTPADGGAERVFYRVPEDPRLPRVLLIGDSISIGYTVPTRELLDAVANVQRIPWNGGDTNLGLERLDEAIGAVKWDVIHFNFGLHDLRYADGRHQVPIEQYEANLRKIVHRLKATGASLVWASTTPVPEGAAGRRAGDETDYNAVAATIMEENGVPTNDLYAFALPRLADIQQPRNVHFTDAGSRQLARRVAASILTALGRPVPESLSTEP